MQVNDFSISSNDSIYEDFKETNKDITDKENLSIK